MYISKIVTRSRVINDTVDDICDSERCKENLIHLFSYVRYFAIGLPSFPLCEYYADTSKCLLMDEKGTQFGDSLREIRKYNKLHVLDDEVIFQK